MLAQVLVTKFENILHNICVAYYVDSNKILAKPLSRIIRQWINITEVKPSLHHSFGFVCPLKNPDTSNAWLDR